MVSVEPPGDTDIFILKTDFSRRKFHVFFFVPWNLPSFFGQPGETPVQPLWVMIVWFESLRMGGFPHPPSNQLPCYPTSVREVSYRKGFFFLFGNDYTALYVLYSVQSTYGVHILTFITLEHTQPWIVELRSTSSFDDIQLPNTFPRGPLIRLTLVLVL